MSAGYEARAGNSTRGSLSSRRMQRKENTLLDDSGPRRLTSIGMVQAERGKHQALPCAPEHGLHHKLSVQRPFRLSEPLAQQFRFCFAIRANKTPDRKQPVRLFELMQQKDSTVCYWMTLVPFGIGALRQGYNGRLRSCGSEWLFWPPSITFLQTACTYLVTSSTAAVTFRHLCLEVRKQACRSSFK